MKTHIVERQRPYFWLFCVLCAGVVLALTVVSSLSSEEGAEAATGHEPAGEAAADSPKSSVANQVEQQGAQQGAQQVEEQAAEQRLALNEVLVRVSGLAPSEQVEGSSNWWRVAVIEVQQAGTPPLAVGAELYLRLQVPQLQLGPAGSLYTMTLRPIDAQATPPRWEVIGLPLVLTPPPAAQPLPSLSEERFRQELARRLQLGQDEVLGDPANSDQSAAKASLTTTDTQQPQPAQPVVSAVVLGGRGSHPGQPLLVEYLGTLREGPALLHWGEGQPLAVTIEAVDGRFALLSGVPSALRAGLSLELQPRAVAAP